MSSTAQSIRLEESPLSDSDLSCLEGVVRQAFIEESGYLELQGCSCSSAFAELASRRVGTEVALVTVVVKDRQVFIGQFGLSEPWACHGETPLTHSFCQHVVATSAPLVINDARRHPVLKDNGAISDLGVMSYLGVPIRCDNEQVIGSLCVIDPKPRIWTSDELEHLQDLAHLVVEFFTRHKQQRRSHENLHQLFQSQKLEALGSLSASVSHDFNNLLMVIQSSVELLKQKNFDQSAKQHIREIEVTVKNANAIVNRLVMWNRQQPENEQLVCLAKSVEEAVVLIDALMPTGVTTNYDLPNYPCPINISPGQLNQILLNLCSNAEYAMREAGGRLSIGVNMDSDKRWVTLTVGDSGPGIAEELKQRIFSPFYSTKPNGSGIGLSMVNAIVQNVGGKITIADRIGGGSVFTVLLPSARPDLAQRDDNVHAVGVTSSTTKREATELPRVMLVDDNEMLNTTVSSHLTSLGYAVKGHTSSAKALEELRESSRDFEILISDQSMPEFDGISLAYQVREFDPELPVILITGFSHLLTLELSKKLDICHVLAKPISVKAIAKAIDFYARQRYETTAGPK